MQIQKVDREQGRKKRRKMGGREGERRGEREREGESGAPLNQLLFHYHLQILEPSKTSNFRL